MSSLLDSIANVGSKVGTALNPALGIASAIGSFVGGSQDRKQQERINQQNIEMQRETNKLQYQMFKEANAFNERMALQAFQREAEYNDPRAQVARQLAAGVNPYSKAGSFSGTSGNVDMASPSSASPAALTAPHAQMVGSNFERSIAGFQGIANAIKSLAELKKISSSSELDKANTNRINTLLQGELNDLFADVKLKTAQANYQDVQNMLAQVKAPYEIREMFANAYLLAARGQEAEANAALLKIERRLTGLKISEIRLRLPFIQQELRESIKLIQEKQRTEQSIQTENYSSSELKRAQTETENVMRNFKVLESDAQIKHLTEIARQAHVTGDTKVLENYLKFRGLDARNATEMAMRILADKDKLTNQKEWLEYLRENGVIK